METVPEEAQSTPALEPEVMCSRTKSVTVGCVTYDLDFPIDEMGIIIPT